MNGARKCIYSRTFSIEIKSTRVTFDVQLREVAKSNFGTAPRSRLSE